MATGGAENSDMAKCSSCLFETSKCTIPDEDPEVTTRD